MRKTSLPTLLLLLLSFPSYGQEWIGWKTEQPPASPAAAQQGSGDVSPSPSASEASGIDSSSHLRAECEAKAAQAYPLTQIGFGLSKRREEFVSACLAKGNQANELTASGPMTRPECDAEAARAYPLTQIGFGLSQKREAYAAACMARGTPDEKLEINIRAECEAQVVLAYPLTQWGPGLKNKRKELYATCVARRSQ